MDKPVIYQPPLLVMLLLEDAFLAEVIHGITGLKPYSAAIMVYSGPRADQPMPKED